jgi:hypothetical protein
MSVYAAISGSYAVPAAYRASIAQATAGGYDFEAWRNDETPVRGPTTPEEEYAPEEEEDPEEENDDNYPDRDMLMSFSRKSMVAQAEREGLTDIPDSWNKSDIADAIIHDREANGED